MREARPIPFAGHEPQPGVETVLERPPAGMARGLFVVPQLVVVLVALALLLATLGYHAVRLRGDRRR